MATSSRTLCPFLPARSVISDHVTDSIQSLLCVFQFDSHVECDLFIGSGSFNCFR